MNSVEFPVTPYESVGPLRFNMSRAEVKSILGDPDGFKSGAASNAETPEVADSWLYSTRWNVVVFFSATNELAAVLLFGDSYGILDGVPLSGNYDQVIANVVKQYPKARFLYDYVAFNGFNCQELGIAIHPTEDDGEAAITGVEFYRPGYLDHLTNTSHLEEES